MGMNSRIRAGGFHTGIGCYTRGSSSHRDGLLHKGIWLSHGDELSHKGGGSSCTGMSLHKWRWLLQGGDLAQGDAPFT